MSKCPQVSKSQKVRVLDVVLLGPATVAAGLYRGPLPPAARGALVLYGVTTIAYNLQNYLATRKAQ